MRRHATAFSLLLVMLAGLAVAQHPCGTPAEASPPCHSQQHPTQNEADRGCHPEGSCTHPCHLAAEVGQAAGLEVFGPAEAVAPPAVPPPFTVPPDTIDHIPLA